HHLRKLRIFNNKRTNRRLAAELHPHTPEVLCLGPAPDDSLQPAHAAQEPWPDGCDHHHAGRWHWSHHSYLHGGLRHPAGAAALSAARSAGGGVVEDPG